MQDNDTGTWLARDGDGRILEVDAAGHPGAEARPGDSRPVAEAMEPGGKVRAVASCGLDWQGPREAWDRWFSGSHALAHQKGIDGLSACCPDLRVRAVADREAEAG